MLSALFCSHQSTESKMEVFPTEYIPFTIEQREKAAATNLEEFLRCRGEKLLPAGRDKRLGNDHSVTIRGSQWFDHGAETGGRAISFVMRYYALDYPQAVALLLDAGVSPAPAAEPSEAVLTLPEASDNMHRLFAYLCSTRGLSPAVVAVFVRAGLLYEEARFHNAVFVGRDDRGIPRHGHLHSTGSLGPSFRLNLPGSDSRYSFHHTGTDGRLYVFEAPIDLLSFITLNPEDWEQHSYLACCGLSMKPLLFRLERQPALNQVFLCLDNDPAGDAACLRMATELQARGLSVRRLCPSAKDWNDELTRHH